MTTLDHPELPFASYRGSEPYVFVSYSHDDAASVYPELIALSKSGINVWYDEGISPGSSWPEELAKAIDNCAVFVLFVSPRSVASDNCTRELLYAVDEKRHVLAVHLEETELPAGIKLSIGDRQAILKPRLSEAAYRAKLQTALSELLPSIETDEHATATPQQFATPQKPWQRRALVGTLAVTIAIGVAIVLRYQQLADDERATLIANVQQLAERGRSVDAYALVSTNSDSEPLFDLLVDVATIGSFRTSEPNAAISIKAYAQPDGEWVYLGNTPIENQLIPVGALRILVEAPGFEPVEFAALNPGPYFENDDPPVPAAYDVPFSIPLVAAGTVPDGMIHMPETTLDVAMFGSATGMVRLEPFYIDRHEVDNQSYKAFVDAGGYDDPQYWTGLDFVVDGKTLAWDEARQLFLDATGRPGPSTWELGSYPTGTEQEPVLGVSWYEAVAFSRFVDKSLPTAQQWSRVAYGIASFAPAWQESVTLGRFDSERPIDVGESASLGPFGAVDMPGNAREWVWNVQGGQHITVGGSYSEPAKLFAVPQRRPAMDRAKGNGFRLAVNPEPLREELLADLPWEVRDVAAAVPISDDAFDAMKWQLAYVPGKLNETVVSVEEHDTYIQETIEFDTGYDARMRIHLVRPPGEGPTQSILFFGGVGDFNYAHDSGPDIELVIEHLGSAMVSGGRAFVYPIYYGSFERYDGYNELESMEQWQAAENQRVVRWRQDIGRTIDYLETRSEFDNEAIAFMGISYGAMVGSNAMTVESRIKAAVLLSGGIVVWPHYLPLTDPLNYFPRFTQPILMLSGENDFVVPVDTVQIPSFEKLTTEHKRHVIFPATGHWPFPRTRFLKEVGDWLDTHLGGDV